MSINNNNNNNNPIANEPPVEDGGGAVAEGGGVRVSSDDAANSSEYPESTEQDEGGSPNHGGSSDSGSKTGERGQYHEEDCDHCGGVGGAGRDADTSHDPPPATATTANKKHKKTSDESNEREASTFPVKLHRILSNLEHEDIISWLPHGRSWRINQQKRFEEEVLPLYFVHGRYTSFARQVNGWGFRRVMQGSDYNSYYHELFLRNLPSLCERMRRLTTKDIANRKMDSSAVPDFYSLSRDHPLPETTDGTDEGDHASTVRVAAAAACGQTVPRTVDHTLSSVTAAQAVPRKMTAIPGNVLMRNELQMLEKRRKEIVDRIALLSANLGQINPSNNDASPAIATAAAYSSGPGLDANMFGGGHRLGNPPPTATTSAQPYGGDGIGASLTQQGILALLRLPGGAQLLAQLANRTTIIESQARSAPPPPAFNQNPLFYLPGGTQLFQHLMSSNKSRQTSLQVNAAAPVAYTPMTPVVPAAPQMGDAQLLLERLMQVVNNNRNTTDSSMLAPTPTLASSSSGQVISVQAPHLSPPVTAGTAPPPPPLTGLSAAILQMLIAAQQQQTATPSAAMHASMLLQQANNNFEANGGPNAILQMLTAATGNSNAAAAVPTAQPPPPPPVQALFVPSSSTTGNPRHAAAMMQQLHQNGNLDLASLLSMTSHASSLNPPSQDKKPRGN